MATDRLAVLLRLAKLTAAAEALLIAVYQVGGITLTSASRDAVQGKPHRLVGRPGDNDTYILTLEPCAEGEDTLDFALTVENPAAEEAA
jgi:hypothetical protein